MKEVCSFKEQCIDDKIQAVDDHDEKKEERRKKIRQRLTKKRFGDLKSKYRSERLFS